MTTIPQMTDIVITRSIIKNKSDHLIARPRPLLSVTSNTTLKDYNEARQQLEFIVTSVQIEKPFLAEMSI